QAVTIPPMDGALRPNTALDEAHIMKSCEEPDNIVSVAGELIYSSGRDIFAMNNGKPIASFDSAITAIAANSSGTVAVGLNAGGIVFHKGKASPLDGFNCPTALAFDGANSLYICNGSDTHSASEWAADLMRK